MIVNFLIPVIQIKWEGRRVTVKYSSLFLHFLITLFIRLSLQNFFMEANTNVYFPYTQIYSIPSDFFVGRIFLYRHTDSQYLHFLTAVEWVLPNLLNQSRPDRWASKFLIFLYFTQSYNLESKHIWGNADETNKWLSQARYHFPSHQQWFLAPPVSAIRVHDKTARSLLLWGFPVRADFYFSYYRWGRASFHMF